MQDDERQTNKYYPILNPIEKFRGFAFVTFKSSKVLESVLEKKHIILNKKVI